MITSPPLVVAKKQEASLAVPRKLCCARKTWFVSPCSFFVVGLDGCSMVTPSSGMDD